MVEHIFYQLFSQSVRNFFPAVRQWAFFVNILSRWVEPPPCTGSSDQQSYLRLVSPANAETYSPCHSREGGNPLLYTKLLRGVEPATPTRTPRLLGGGGPGLTEAPHFQQVLADVHPVRPRTRSRHPLCAKIVVA